MVGHVTSGTISGTEMKLKQAEFPIVVEARKATFWPTSGLKERHINNSGVSATGTLFSASMVPKCGDCLGKRTKQNHSRSYNSGISSITPVGNALPSFCASLELARVVNWMCTYSWLSPPFRLCLYLYRFLWRTRLLAHVWACFSCFNKRVALQELAFWKHICPEKTEIEV